MTRATRAFLPFADKSKARNSAANTISTMYRACAFCVIWVGRTNDSVDTKLPRYMKWAAVAVKHANMSYYIT